MLDDIKNILVEEGYEIIDLKSADGVIRIKDLDCGVVVTGVLENNIFYLSLFCRAIKKEDLTGELLNRMLDLENGISTSFFKLQSRNDGTSMITLNNFCKLQTMGDDDRDDILSCLNFLLADLIAAKELLG